MNRCERFLSSLLSEFKRKAPPQVRSLWADLMELEEALDERAFAAAREQALRRIRVLGRAASAANAHQVQSPGHTLELMLVALMQAPAAARPELLTHLYETMWMLTHAVHAMDVEDPVSERAGRPPELTLVKSCTD